MKRIFLLFTTVIVLIYACSPKPQAYKYACAKSGAEFMSELTGVINFGGFEISKIDTIKKFELQCRKLLEVSGTGKNQVKKSVGLEINKNVETGEVAVYPIIIETQGKSEDIEYIELKNDDKIWSELKISIDRIKKICETKK